jgi:hypothetical protein
MSSMLLEFKQKIKKKLKKKPLKKKKKKKKKQQQQQQQQQQQPWTLAYILVLQTLSSPLNVFL